MSQLQRTVNHCDACEHQWLPRSPLPAHCPKCGSREWNGKKVRKPAGRPRKAA